MALSQKNKKRTLEIFQDQYLNPNSAIFLERNNKIIKTFLEKNKTLTPLKTKDIIEYKQQLYHLSKDREIRLLKGRKRQISHRSWLSFGPNNILLADITFLRRISDPTKRHRPVLVRISVHRSLNRSISQSFINLSILF